MSAHISQVSAGSLHRHLSVTPPEPAVRTHWHRGLRWAVLGMAFASVAAYAASYFMTWWHFTLYAPQYPYGLRLEISLTGMGGDVREIDMLNHYIGMGRLEDAAKLERKLAGWGVGLIAVVVVATTMLAGKKLGKAVLVPALAFPAVFLADSFYWLHRFGHGLDPHAPLRIRPFTPQLFGNGEIGQFMTFALPGPGFWLALSGLGLLAAAVTARHRVCRDCPRRNGCGAICSLGLVGVARRRPS